VETDVTPIDHLRWKLAAAPDPEKTHVVAEAEGHIVGCHLSLVREYLAGGAVTVRTDIDVAVAPEWRGRGVNGAQTKLSIETSPATFVLTTTDNPSLVRADHYRGHRPLRNRLISTSCDLTQAVHTSGTRVDSIASFDARTETMWTKAAEPYEFIAAPSAAWLNWRYCDLRGGNGFVLQAEQGCEVLGFVAARISRGKGYIAYLLALPERSNVVQALTASCLARFQEAGLREAVCALPGHHPYRGLLTEQGFSQNRRRIPLTTRPGYPGDPERPSLRKPNAAVHIMLGDTDLI